MLVGLSRYLGFPRGAGHVTVDAGLNYLESHDDHTAADLVRHALHQPASGHPVERASLFPMHEALLRRMKLAASALVRARGPLMLAQGQEWGRAKVRPEDNRLDGNSYCRDDATNHLDWHERERNRPLVDHYRRLLQIRREWLTDVLTGPAPLMVLHTDRMWAFGYTAATRRGPVVDAVWDGRRGDCADANGGERQGLRLRCGRFMG